MTTRTTAQSATTQKGRTIEGWHVLAALVGFFVSVTAVNFSMAYLAISTYSGIDTPDAYRSGLAYNARIAAEERQAALGWQDMVTWDGLAAPLRLTLVNKQGGPVTGLHVTARVQRPATNRFDHMLVMSERAPGVYEVRVTGVEVGNWAVVVTAAQSKNDGFKPVYEARRRVWLKQ